MFLCKQTPNIVNTKKKKQSVLGARRVTMLWRVLASTLQWYMPCRSWNIHIQVNIDKNRGAKIKKQASYFEKRNHFDSAFFTISPTLYEIDKLQMSCKFY